MVGYGKTRTLSRVEYAIACPLAVEWEAVCERLRQAQPNPDPSDSGLESVFGEIAGSTVLCVKIGKGQAEAASTVTQVLDRWRPRWLVLCGIAGGFRELGAKRGDLVIANVVVSIDFGKLTGGTFRRRLEHDYRPDRLLLGQAETLTEVGEGAWRNRIRKARPDGGTSSDTEACLGYVGSGNYVVDDTSHDLFLAVRKACPELVAVEMEGCGVGAAIWRAQSDRTIGTLMVRGISDEPCISSSELDGGTAQRKVWKAYAADIAAAFVEELIHHRANADTKGPPLPQRRAMQSIDELLEQLEIVFSPTAEECISRLHSSRDKITELLEKELRGHKLLLTLDYESQPRALRSDYYVILTKLGHTLTVENVSRAMPQEEVYARWLALSAAYTRAYRLPFREKHSRLVREPEFRKSFDVMRAMIVRLVAFIETTRGLSDERLFGRLHRLKNDAIKTLERAENLYHNYLNFQNDDQVLGQAVIALDSVVSSVHKVVLEYGDQK